VLEAVISCLILGSAALRGFTLKVSFLKPIRDIFVCRFDFFFFIPAHPQAICLDPISSMQGSSKPCALEKMSSQGRLLNFHEGLKHSTEMQPGTDF